MNTLKKYVIDNIKKQTELHSSDIDENNLNISDKTYSNNCVIIEKVLKDISNKIYLNTTFIVCDIYAYNDGSIGIDVYDNRLFKQILHYNTVF